MDRMTRRQWIGNRVLTGLVVGAFLAAPVLAASSPAAAIVGLCVAVWWLVW